MKEVRFDPGGEPLAVEVICTSAQDGSYELRLWEPRDNTMVLQKMGNFLNPADDKYVLPQPVIANAHRIVQAIVVVVLTPPITKYSAGVILTQGDTEIGREFLEGTSGEPSVALNIFCRLVG